MKSRNIFNHICTGALGLFLFLVIIPRFTTIYATTKYWVGTSGGSFSTNSNWSTTSGSACGANQNTTAPGSSDVATFNPDCTNSVSIDSAISVSGIDINASYTGTITQASSTANTITVGASAYDQADGTFTGGNAAISFNGAVTISNGTFTFTSATTTFSGVFTANFSGGTINHNSGTLLFVPCGGDVTFNVPTSLTVNNVTVNNACNRGASIPSGDTLIINGTLTLTNGHLNGVGTFNAKGVVSVGASFDGGDGLLLIDGSGNQSFTIPSGAELPKLTLNNALTTVNFDSGASAALDGDFEIIVKLYG